jgi:hypothetical protein
MDEAERCTDVASSIAAACSRRRRRARFRSSFNTKLLELDVDPVMPALVRFRDERMCSACATQRELAVLCARSRRSCWRSGEPRGRFQISAFCASGGVEAGHGRCFHRLFAGLPRGPESTRSMSAPSFAAIGSVARKEFIHIWRDRRVLILLLVLPPIFTLVFGHAFEVGEMTDAPAVLMQRRQLAARAAIRGADRSEQDVPLARARCCSGVNTDCCGRGAAALVVPAGWGEGLANGKPIPLQLHLDASDTNIAPQLSGSVQETLGEFQLAERQEMIDALPDEIFDLAEKIPEEVRKQFTSAMEPWTVEDKMLYNPRERFIDYVIPASSGSSCSC